MPMYFPYPSPESSYIDMQNYVDENDGGSDAGVEDNDDDKIKVKEAKIDSEGETEPHSTEKICRRFSNCEFYFDALV